MMSLFDNIGVRARVDADAAYRGLAHAPRAQFVEFQNVAGLDHDDVSDRALHRARHFGMALQLPVFAVNRNEIARPHQVDDHLQLFLAGVSADVHGWLGAVVIDHLGVAAEQVVDDPVNRLFHCRE